MNRPTIPVEAEHFDFVDSCENEEEDEETEIRV